MRQRLDQPQRRAAVQTCRTAAQPLLWLIKIWGYIYISTLGILFLTLLVGGFGSGSDKKIISPPGTKPGGNYSQGILTGDFDAEVKQSLENIDAVLKAAGMTSADVVSA